MVNSIYSINKGVNRSIVFKGLKAQYIWWLGIGITILLLLFAILYILGVPVLICLIIIFSAGGYWFWWVYKMSRIHGEHGLMKKTAARSVPKAITIKRNLL